MAKDVVIPVRLDKEEKEILAKIAKDKGVGTSTLIRMLIREFISQNKK